MKFTLKPNFLAFSILFVVMTLFMSTRAFAMKQKYVFMDIQVGPCVYNVSGWVNVDDNGRVLSNQLLTASAVSGPCSGGGVVSTKITSLVPIGSDNFGDYQIQYLDKDNNNVSEADFGIPKSVLWNELISAINK